MTKSIILRILGELARKGGFVGMKEDTEGQESTQSPNALEQRLYALHELAQTTSQSISASSIHPQHIPLPRPHRVMWILLIVAILICSVVVILAYNIFFVARITPVSADPIELDLAQVQLTCIRDASWSPDGKSVAVLGYQTGCPSSIPISYDYHPGLLVIYSARTGKALTLTTLDGPIDAVLHVQPPVLVTPSSTAPFANTSKQVIAYTQLLWSPDGKQMAISFLVSVATNFHQDTDGQMKWDTDLTRGILLMGADGEAAKVLSHKISPNDMGSGRWNINTGEYVSSGTSQTSPANATQSLGYTWGTDGSLIPQTPSAASGTPAIKSTAPVGNPSGGSAFTIWQPARIGALYAAPGVGEKPVIISGVYVFVSVFAAWSPDGKFLVTSSEVSGLLGDVGKVTPAMRQELEPPPLPTIPIRDRGLAQVISQISSSDHTQFYVAWSQNGQLLASESSDRAADGALRPNSVTVSLYSCASGKRLATIHPAKALSGKIAASALSVSAAGFSEPLLRWSPDDTHLLIYDQSLSRIMIFDTARLSHDAYRNLR